MTFKILIPIGCRSDEGLSAPVIRLLKKEVWQTRFNSHHWCRVDIIQLEPQNFIVTYKVIEDEFDVYGKPDLILITGDRIEMCAAACAAFHNNVKIAHLYAGIVNDPVTTYDDIDRQECERE